jgi:ParB family chromosome partitioning protein
MAARASRKAAAKKSGARKKTSQPRRRADARRRLTPAREERGIERAQVKLDPADPAVASLAGWVEEAGGTVLAAYREPLSGQPLLLAALPRGAVEPTPFQRDLSPTHTKRLARKIEETGAFLDPLIVVRGADGGFWTPNGRHRLAAAKVLGLRQVTALVSPDERLAFRILALNTEKAHNLKDRSLEAIRMARALAKRSPRAREQDFSAELEGAELLTLGTVYEQQSRFAGGAYAPFLRKVDRFSDRPLPASLRERAGFAARLLEIDARVKEIAAQLQKRGFRSPYLRNLVVARINPVRFHKARRGDTSPPMRLGPALTRMAAAARRFDVASVRERDLALVAAVAGD